MAEEENKSSTQEETQEPKVKKLVSPEEFITRWPLYTPAPVDGFSPPASISYHCDTPITCGKETTWLRVGDPQYTNLEGSDRWFKWVWYRCGRCNKQYLSVMYWETEQERRLVKRRVPLTLSSAVPPTPARVSVTTKVQKIGQFPALSIDIPKALEKNLGKDHAELYKKALICRNANFGLAAVSYMRRVVEDKTEELIEVVAQLAESHQIDAEIVKKIREAKEKQTTYDNKLKIASTVFPSSLTIEGVNPLDLLFGLVSAGLHDLTEEQCIQIADETKSVFEFTFTRLRAEIREGKDFADKVKRWAGGNHPATKKPTA